MFSKVKKDFCFPPVYVGNRAILVQNENEQVFIDMGIPFQIVFLPGHTEDSIGLLMLDNGKLFCGDASMNAIMSVARHTIWIDDAVVFRCSWDRMLAMKPTKIYPSHGPPFSPKDLVKYRHFLDNRMLIPPK